jgi:hypothetical protein
MHVPGYAIAWLDVDQLHPKDRHRLETMPAWLFAEIRDKLANLTTSQALHCGGCMWASDDGCRHYEWRPQVCRDFAIGGPRCTESRQAFGMEPVVVSLEAPEMAAQDA